MSEHAIQKRPAATGWLSSRQAAAPIAALLFLSPVLTELLAGFLRVTTLWLLIPEMGVYGVGALIIREVARRGRRGWGTILLLGIAFAIAEECVILQTSLTPRFFPPAGISSFGWAYGVQWIYLLAMLGYESVYAIVIPIQLAELLFPARRDELWLSRQGIIAAGIIFLVSCVGVWWLWAHHGLPRYGSSTYQVSPLHVGLALAAIVVLVTGTLWFGRPSGQPLRSTPRRARSPWLVGLLAFIFGLFWFVLIALPYIDAALLPGASSFVSIAIGLAWAGLAFLVIRRLSAARGWQDIHRLALIFGATLASMAGGALTVITAAPIDRLGKLIVDLIAVVLFAALAWWLGQRGPAVAGQSGA